MIGEDDRMNILVTGAEGFLGRNLVENLKNIRDGKNRTRETLIIGKIYEFDRQNSEKDLNRFCEDCDFVFDLAGANRPKNPDEFQQDNVGFSATLLETLKSHHNLCPVMLSSSVQATLAGRFGSSEYGLSKKEAEKMFFRYSEETGVPVYVYRFPNLTGKWIRPNYNSAVATFCHNIANELPITVHDENTELEMLFVDDLLEEMYDLLEGHPHRCSYPPAGEDGYDGLTPKEENDGEFCYVPVTHKATLGYIVKCLRAFHDQQQTLIVPAIPSGSFEKKLYSMYLSYLPKNKVAFDLKMNCDSRGSFTELLKTEDHGQFSVNISKPGITKGQHWHNSKWEFFIVVAGHGLIRERKIGTDEVIEFEVSGERIQAVHMLPGYTHSIINLSDTENLVTLMWANEMFDPDRPDTFSEPV